MPNEKRKKVSKLPWSDIEEAPCESAKATTLLIFNCFSVLTFVTNFFLFEIVWSFKLKQDLKFRQGIEKV
jgi:hypothetical protein